MKLSPNKYSYDKILTHSMLSVGINILFQNTLMAQVQTPIGKLDLLICNEVIIRIEKAI